MSDEQLGSTQGRSVDEPIAAPGEVPPVSEGHPHYPPPYGPQTPYCYPPPPPPKRSRLGTLLLGVLLAASLLGNL